MPRPVSFTIARTRVTVLSGTNVASESDDPVVPDRYMLRGNYPNPFNPSTTIRFETADRAPITIDVFDVTGRLVGTLANRTFKPGVHELRFDAGSYPSGVYVATMQSPADSQSILMSLVK